jgi:hypothetical protein
MYREKKQAYVHDKSKNKVEGNCLLEKKQTGELPQPTYNQTKLNGGVETRSQLTLQLDRDNKKA